MAGRRTMRRHVIVSQGGKHGKTHGTYLRDQPVSEAVAEVIPPTLVDVTSEPGQPTKPAPKPEVKAPKQSVPPPSVPTPKTLTPPGSAKALRRWSEPKMLELAKQEGIEAEGLDKNGLRRLLSAHFGIK